MRHPSSSSLEASGFCANQIAKYGRTGCGVTGFGIKIYKHAWLLDRWESKAASMYSWSVSWSTNFPVYLSSLRHRTNFFWSFTEFFLVTLSPALISIFFPKNFACHAKCQDRCKRKVWKSGLATALYAFTKTIIISYWATWFLSSFRLNPIIHLIWRFWR